MLAPSTLSVSRGVSPPGVSWPTLLVRHLGRRLGRPSRLSGRFRPVGPQQTALSITAGELLAIQLGLFQFRSALQGRTVAVFCDYTTSVTSLRKQGGTWSPLLNTLAQAILRWKESLSIRLAPQFLPGSDNVLADALSRPHQLPHPEWSIHMTVFLALRRLWPVPIVSLQLRPLIVVPFPSPLSGIRGQQARTRFSSTGTAFRRTRSIRWLSSAYSREAPDLHGDGTHSCDSPLGSAPLVFGPGPALAGSSSGSGTIRCRQLDATDSMPPTRCQPNSMPPTRCQPKFY